MKEVRPEKVREKIHAVIFLNGGLGGGFKYFLFSPLPVKMIQLD